MKEWMNDKKEAIVRRASKTSLALLVKRLFFSEEANIETEDRNFNISQPCRDGFHSTRLGFSQDILQCLAESLRAR
jgi:hypothetical protein